MALMNFVDKVGPAISAAWLNTVDALKFTVFGDATTKAAARTALTQDAPWALTQGGTGSQTGYSTAYGAFGPTATVASASTTDLGAVSSNAHSIIISGTTTIASFGNSASTNAPFYFVRFTGALTLTNSASLILPGGANLTVAAGDTLLAEFVGSSTWRVWAVWRVAAASGGFGVKTSIASAATTDLGTAGSNLVTITGTTGITSFGSGASTTSPAYLLTFSGALTITSGANLTLPSSVSSITTQVGDSCLAVYNGSGSWTIWAYWRGRTYIPTIRDVSGTTDSPTAADADNIVTLSSASSTVVTLNGGIVQIGQAIQFYRLGAGSVTFAAGASQTVNSPGSRLTIPEQYASVVATYRATNTWILSGV